MNIFYLHNDPAICAQLHNDKHVVKMIVETAQILSTAHFNNGSHQPWMYKPTHKHHPCTVWAGSSTANYQWAWELGMELCKEYTYRYGKRHKTQDKLELLRTAPPVVNEYWTPPPQCMPEQYHRDNYVDGYREYYRAEKAGFSRWTKRPIPDFMADVI